MKKHSILRKFIYGLEKKLAYSLIVEGKAGYGKTTTVLKTLKEQGLKERINYLYVSNYITPVEFYKLLQEVNRLKEPKILILDDIEETLRNKKIIGLLKGALWEAGEGRKVCWHSGTHKIEKKSFIFDGRIIILLNELKKEDKLIFAVKDRGFYYKIDLEDRELLELIRFKAKTEPYRGIPTSTRVKIVEYIERAGRGSEELTLRILPKAYNAYLLSPQHYQQLVKEML